MQQRYARQTILPELGQGGQRKLKEASVLCIGAGGLGSPALLYLAAAGVGRIGIIDDDVVDLTNLQRQVLFCEADAGKPKSEAARQALELRNSDIIVECYPERFSSTNAEKLLAKYDVILDGTDNFASKFLINDACVKFGKPLVYASILGFEAQVSVFWAEHGPCYRCLYPNPPSGHIANCAEAGVIGAMAGIAGTVQALEAIKMLLGLRWCQEKGLEPLLGRLWLLDAKTMETRTLTLPKNPNCAVCSKPRCEIMLLTAEPICASTSHVQSFAPEEAMAMVNRAIFIDVREVHECASGIIPEAQHIPLGVLLNGSELTAKLPKDAPLIVYCQRGMRSLDAVRFLQMQGYQNVGNLAGGIMQWPGAMAPLPTLTR